VSKFIADLFTPRTKTIRRPRTAPLSRHPRLRLLELEDRRVLTVPYLNPDIFFPPPGISLNSTGTLSIVGDDRDTEATVSVEAGKVKVSLAEITYKQVGLGSVVPIASITETQYDLANVSQICFYGHGGNDEFYNNTAIPSTAYGHGGDDVLQGGTAADKLYGGAGLDMLEGRAGDDLLDGGGDTDVYLFNGLWLGSDTVAEAANLDSDELDFKGLTSGSGVTIDLASTAKQAVHHWGANPSLYLTLTSGSGVEDVYGTNAKDVLKGNARGNGLYANGGDDELYGYGGDDWLVGGGDNDKIDAGTGTNHVEDGTGNDSIDLTGNAVGVTYITGGGSDTVYGSDFADKITGSGGNDVLYGYMGGDTLTGGSGNDSLDAGTGQNTVSDGPGNDLVDLSDNGLALVYTTGGGNDTVYGTVFADKITGSAGNDKLYGNGGNDRLFGLAGTDELYGGDGGDWLEAGSAAEKAEGGSGFDYNAHQWAIVGTTFNDVVQNGSPTCVFLSALSGAALQGIDLAGRITYLGNYTYNVQLFNADNGQTYNQQVQFDGTFSYVDGNGQVVSSYGPWSSSYAFWDPVPQGGGEEFWTVLYQRAYLAMSKPWNLDFNFKDPDYAMYALTGRGVVDGDWDNPAGLQAALIAGKVVTAGDADETATVYDSHSYTVMEVFANGGTWWIKLRNPWGVDVKGEDLQNGTKMPSGSNDDGIIVMTWDQFVSANDFDRLSIS
jgi:Ca2+-binding RTX toxin-like protein